MRRNRVDPAAASEWLTKSKDLLMDLITEILRAREGHATDRRRKAKGHVTRKTKPRKPAPRAKKARV
jgi:hypothetical protein